MKSMVNYLLEQENKNQTFFRPKTLKYAKLLSTPLTLGMFIPCDLEGNVLEEPNSSDEKYNEYNIVQTIFKKELFDKDLKEYQQAQDRVLFNGFQFHHKNEVSTLIIWNGNNRSTMNFIKDGDHAEIKFYMKTITTIEELVGTGVELKNKI